MWVCATVTVWVCRSVCASSSQWPSPLGNVSRWNGTGTHFSSSSSTRTPHAGAGGRQTIMRWSQCFSRPNSHGCGKQTTLRHDRKPQLSFNNHPLHPDLHEIAPASQLSSKTLGRQFVRELEVCTLLRLETNRPEFAQWKLQASSE